MALLELLMNLEWGTLRWVFRLILIGAVVFIAWKNHFAEKEEEDYEGESEEGEEGEYREERMTEEEWRERDRRRRKEEERAARIEMQHQRDQDDGPRRRVRFLTSHFAHNFPIKNQELLSKKSKKQI